MPIYEYECTSCHHHCDLLQKISDEPEKQCPHCGKNDLIKLVSAAGFQLKGTGWYATDFKDKKVSAKSSSENQTNASASAAKPESTSESKNNKTSSD